MKPILHIKLVE